MPAGPFGFQVADLAEELAEGTRASRSSRIEILSDTLQATVDQIEQKYEMM
jgi:hypothetical protein